MAKLKMLKMPKAPKMPKKPKATASVTSKQAWINKVKDLRQKYYHTCTAVNKENASRKKENEQSIKLSQVIAGIGNIVSVHPSKFTTKIIRMPRKGAKKKIAVGGVKRKKTATKRKTAPKRKTARKSRRY